MTRAQEEIQQITDQLVRSAQTSGGTVLGARAGNIVRAALPGFRPESYGARSLREFISQHVPALHVVGFSGPDPIYGLADAVLTPDPEGRSQATIADLWRVWVSPGSPLALSISPSSGGVRAVPRDADQVPDEVRVSSASLETHRLIAEEFSRDPDLPPGLAATLAAILTRSSEDPRPWWQKWQEVLRSNDPVFYQRWSERRRAGLEQALLATLDASGLGEEARQHAFGTISARTARSRATRGSPSRAPHTTTRSLPTANAIPSGIDIREIVRFVIGKMGEDELRALPLPLGLVLDAISAQNGRTT